MSSYRYCDECQAALDEPTIEEDLYYNQICHICGTEQKRCFSNEEWLIKLSDRIRELEK